MPIVKPKWKKRLAATLCSMLLLCAALPITAFADDVHIATAYQPFMYFEKWTLITQTPETFKGGQIWSVITNINGKP